MMEFVNNNIIKIILREIFFTQIFIFSQTADRCKDNGLIRLLQISVEKSLFILRTNPFEAFRSLLQDFFSVRNK